MNVLHMALVGVFLTSALTGCVAAECRPGSHHKGGRCVADDAGFDGSAGTAGAGGSGGSAGAGGDDDAGLNLDAGPEVDTGQPMMCFDGFESDGMGGCRDIDECSIDNGGCDTLTTCTNVLGGRNCGPCPAGYNGTGEVDCVDIDECTIDNGGCDTAPMVTCTNTDGARSCGACPPGYTGDGIGNHGCTVTNECLDNNGGCDPAVQCSDTPEGRTCGACPAGYVGDGAQMDGCVPQLATLRMTPDFAEPFAPSTTRYSAVAGPFVRHVQVFATTEVQGAVIRVGETIVDAYDSRFHFIGSAAASIPVTVTDPHGRATTYTVTITRDGVASQRAYIKPAAPTDNQYLSFGLKVAVSGDTLAISRRSPGLYGGAVEIYVRNGNGWVHQATLDPYVESGSPVRLNNGFGLTGLDLDGDTLAVGEVAYTAMGGYAGGGVQVYVRNGTTWTQQATLVPLIGDDGDKFGHSVAVSGDRIAVGAPDEDSNRSNAPANDDMTDAGAAYVFVRAGGAWTQEAYVKAGAPSAGDHFGFDVDLYRSTLLIGAPYEDGSGVGTNPPADEGRADSGALYISTRDSNGVWSAPLYVKSDDAPPGMQLGTSVALGTEAVCVGTAPAYSTGGVAFVVRSTAPGEWSVTRRLSLGSSGAGDAFGLQVDMWSPGAVVVSASADDSTNNVVNGSSNDNGDNNGAAYAFLSTSDSWTGSTRIQIKARNNEAGDGVQGAFGTSVAIFGDTVVMTAPGEDSSANGIQTPGPTQIEDIDASLSYSGGAAYTFR